MQAKPRSTYHVASAATWELIRTGYLAGLSAPALAARYGVSVGAVRKRAGRDGWTKRAYAAREGAGGDTAGAPLQSPQSPPAPPAPPTPESPLALMERSLPPRRFTPERLARRALAQAHVAIADDRPEHARKLLAAGITSLRLYDAVGGLDGDELDQEAQFERQQQLMRVAIFEMARDLARGMAAGQPVPDRYADLAAALDGITSPETAASD